MQFFKKLKIFSKTILYLLVFFYSNELFSTELVDIRFGTNEGKKRIVIDLSNDVGFNSSVSEKKIKINFEKKVLSKYNFKKNNFLDNFVFSKELNQINLKFKKKISSQNNYSIKKNNNKFSRIVIDFKEKLREKKIIIIDPGHGGRDSGAVGIGKLLEKQVTLKIAKLLHAKFRKLEDYEVILTRSNDRYLKLRERTRIAKKNNADIFISLHADYNKSKRTRGVSLYTLSERASDKEAEELARRENKSDLLDGVDLSTESSEVTNILIDLAKRETLNQSSYLANFLIKELKKNMRLLQRTHRFAGFAVLKSLDIPSVLIEMGYLSNPEDSKLLLTKGYQNKIADNILNAVRNYFYWTEQNKG